MPEISTEKTRQAQPADGTGEAHPSSLLSGLRQLGPGLVYALTVIGTGDLVSHSAAGAGYGYALLWTVPVTLVFRFVWISASAKYVLVSGESLLQGYARLGRWVLWIILIAVVMVGHFGAMTQIVMAGRGADLLVHLPTPWSAAIWSLILTLVAFTMLFWGGYRVIEQFSKVLVAIMGGSLMVVALISRPDPVEALRGFFIPTIPGSAGLYSSVLVIMALIGNGAGSTANLTWSDVERFKDKHDIPLLLKGIMTPEDAERAVELGVDGVWVSNHGGRQLDHTEGTTAVLPKIAAAVDGAHHRHHATDVDGE